MDKAKGKDPAFLFYYDRFMSGTFTMSNEQVGAYVRLMCLQANKAFVTEKDMNNICKTYDEDVAGKFLEIEPGKFRNEVLAGIIEQRKVYTESRRNNRLSNKTEKNEEDMNNICETSVEHMVNVNVNKDKSINTEPGNVKKEALVKKIKFRDNVLLTQEENDKIVLKVGEEVKEKAYNKLSNYKKIKGYKTKSDYLTILDWVIDAVTEKKGNGSDSKIENVINEFDNVQFNEGKQTNS